jgi:hypothetical protein
LKISYSLGGLVVKQALMEAKLDSQYTWVAEATCLLVFATPHRGGKFAEAGSGAAKFIRAMSRKTSDDLLEALKKNSAEAAKRFVQGRHLPENCLIISFFEKLSYSILKIVSFMEIIYE